MTRLAAFMLVLAVACALGVITAQHQSRKLFAELEAEQAAARKLGTEWTQLQLEQGTWATNTRVEQVAQKRLGMRQPDAQSTVVITLEERGQ